MRSRGASLLFAARVAGLAIATVSSVLLARFLGPGDFGVYATAVTVANLAVLFGPMGVDQLQLLHGLPERTAVRWAGLVACASVAAGLVLALIWPQADSLTRIAVVAMSVAGAARVALTPWLTTPQKELRFDVRARRDFMTNATPAVGSVLAAAMAGSVLMVVGAHAIILFGIATFAYVHRRPLMLPEGERPPVKFLSGWPYAASAATYTAYVTAGTAIIAATRSSHEVGQYKAAFMFITAAMVLPIVLNNDILRARVATLRGEPPLAWQFIGRMLGLNVLVGTVLLAGVYLVGPPAAQWLYGDGFEVAAGLLTILSLSILPFALNVFAGNALVALGHVRLVLTVQVLLSLIAVVANLALVPAYGLEAAAFTTVGTELLGAASLGAFLARGARTASGKRPEAARSD